MKNTSLWLVILPLLIVSCTTDTIDDTKGLDSTVGNKKLEKLAQKVHNLGPENSANVYDLAGKLHNDLLDIYMSGNYQYNTIVQISQQVEAIAAVNSDMGVLTLEMNLPNNLDKLQEILDNPQAKLNEVIANSPMTAIAKLSLASFMNAVLLWEDDDYGTIYQSIVSYESSVLTSTQFSNEDKRIILTSSSIVRFSLYYAKERKDKDWDSSVGNRVGGVSGAIDNTPAAVGRSLVMGIMINNIVAD
ncbi:hypothetical protein IWX83_002951 [Flavobacterium sp. CG_9.1]|uniref:hypothetical protein n=1 Tax=Flavobacterium sp. CG_9.1 TaxID=2787728 RepID=UPI0018C9089C|nr:hypothetical protein [Flavobacterium sp. CG_9.1]MBG6063141.1 hypothetical protein [Flavobacterium sp. CG_9.1]